ncbi:MAG TPA: flagellar hook-basal body protein [Gemmatimonadales bacterium]
MASAAHALRYWERRQEVVSHNLANVSTDGFKGERAFARLLDGSLPAVDAQTDLRAGTLRPTGNPLDLAMAGDGFFVMDTPDGERLTRGGAFRLDEQGRVVDHAGNALLGDGGPIVVDTEGRETHTTAEQLVVVDRDGEVRVGDRVAGRLRVETIPPGTRLEHAGGNLFVPPADRAPAIDGEREVRQGAIEESNVGSVSALVEMISVQRAFASVQKAMTTLDDARGTLVTEIGRPV